MYIFHVEPMKGREHVMLAFAGKDNPIELHFMEDGRDFDCSAASSIRVKIGETVIDSEIDEDAFDRTEDNIGHVDLLISNYPDITPKAYNMACEVEFPEGEDPGKTIYFGTLRLIVQKPAM